MLEVLALSVDLRQKRVEMCSVIGRMLEYSGGMFKTASLHHLQGKDVFIGFKEK